MSEEWGPWIEHDGSKSCPFQIGDLAQTEGREPPGPLERNEFEITPFVYNLAGWEFVIRYRIRQFKAMKDLKRLVEEPERVPA